MIGNAKENSERFGREVLKLCEKYQCAPAVLIYHPGGTQKPIISTAVFGRPTLEWLNGACEGFAAKIIEWSRTDRFQHAPGYLKDTPDIPGFPGVKDLSKIKFGDRDL